MSTIFKKVLFTSVLLVIGVSVVAFGQINLLSNAITFRTSSNSDNQTKHFGSLSITTASAIGMTPAVICTSSGSNGIGGMFVAPWVGVRGYCSLPYSGTKYGGYFWANNGSNNYGVYSYANGTATSATHYGIYANANGTGTGAINYGVYAKGNGGTQNYGIYASGDSLAGQFNGKGTFIGSWSNVSDEKFKTNIQNLGGALVNVLQLKPKTFYYDTTTYQKLNFPKNLQFGFVAQELGTVFPNLVGEVTAPEGTTNASNAPETYKTVDYINLIPVLVAAIQEQQKRIDTLEAALKAK